MGVGDVHIPLSRLADHSSARTIEVFCIGLCDLSCSSGCCREWRPFLPLSLSKSRGASFR